MIDCSFDIAPKSENIRQELAAPISLVVSPGDQVDIKIVEDPINNIPRCTKCRAYCSSFCTQENETWNCSICNTKNGGIIPQSISSVSNYQMMCDDIIGCDITAIYLSLSFHPRDLDKIRPQIIKFFNTITDRNIIVFLGLPDSSMSVLCPYEPCFQFENGVLTKVQKENFDPKKYENLAAPVVQIVGQKNFDLSKFIFLPSQISSIVKTIEKIKPISRILTFDQVTSISNVLISTFARSPIHLISILPEIKSLPTSFSNIHQNYIRIDILTPSLQDSFAQSITTLPGLLLIYNQNNLARKLSFLIKEKSVFQALINSRINGCSDYQWKLLQYPYMADDKGLLFAPVLPFPNQPFVLDLKPTGKSDKIIAQITAKLYIWVERLQKYCTAIRILNKEIPLSNNIDEVADSVHPNTLNWLWLTRTLQQPPQNVMPGLYRAESRIISHLEEENEKSKICIHTCCSLKYSEIYEKLVVNRLNAKYALCLSPPRELAITPVVNDGVAVFMNSVYSNDPKSTEALSKYYQTRFCLEIKSPIPEWCKTPDPKSLEILTNLL